MAKTFIHFPPVNVVVAILEALAPFEAKQREAILAVVAANPQYPGRPTVVGTDARAFDSCVEASCRSEIATAIWPPKNLLGARKRKGGAK